MSNQMSAEQAQIEIMSQEFAEQVASLTKRLAAERVRAIQLEQEFRNVIQQHQQEKEVAPERVTPEMTEVSGDPDEG